MTTQCRYGRSGDRENPFGSTHFQVHANDWDPMRVADNREVWRWTVYGISSGGMEDPLCGAQHRLKETYEAAQEHARPSLSVPGTELPIWNVRSTVANRGKADVGQRGQKRRD